MTYSEVREMYTFFDATEREKKEKELRRLLNAVNLILTWLIPWGISSFIISKSYFGINAKSALLSFVILALSFPFCQSSQKKEKMYSLFSLVFSYLIMVSTLLTPLFWSPFFLGLSISCVQPHFLCQKPSNHTHS